MVFALMLNSDLFVEHYAEDDVPTEEHVFGRVVIRVQRHEVIVYFGFLLSRAVLFLPLSVTLSVSANLNSF